MSLRTYADLYVYVRTYALAERSPLLLRVLIRHRVEGRMRASTWDRVSDHRGTNEHTQPTAELRTRPLAGHEVSRIVSCFVAKHADETAYLGNLE